MTLSAIYVSLFIFSHTHAGVSLLLSFVSSGRRGSRVRVVSFTD